MSIDLSSEEKNIIASKRKPDSELPTYYNASLNKTVTISRDFESFLILLPDSVKQQAISWLNNSVKLSKINTDRDSLIEKMINNDAADASAQIDSVNAELGNFNEFREKFSSDDTFSSVTEVGQIISDMQRSIGELTMTQDRSTHLVILLDILKNRLSSNMNDEKIQEQLRSWSGPLSSY